MIKSSLFILPLAASIAFGGELSNFWLESRSVRNPARAIHSDEPLERLAGRIGESNNWRGRNNTQQASLLVEEYASPTPENLKWPFVLGYVQAARLSAESGQTFDAVRRLEIAKDKSEGLGEIAALRALSTIVEDQPDLEKALGFEKRALSTGTKWFKRKRISETSGLEPAKEGAGIWEKLKPIIEARIADLERRVDIDRYGLDYVLYREAQTFRRAGHPAALDFTDIAAAFRMRDERLAPSIPGADFEAARKQYLEIATLFPEGVYAEASGLYAERSGEQRTGGIPPPTAVGLEAPGPLFSPSNPKPGLYLFSFSSACRCVSGSSVRSTTSASNTGSVKFSTATLRTERFSSSSATRANTSCSVIFLTAAPRTQSLLSSCATFESVS